MPKMDGFECAKLIRLAEKDTKSHIKIIALTGGVSHNDKQKCIDCGMDGFLSKPVRSDGILKIIQELPIVITIDNSILNVNQPLKLNLSQNSPNSPNSPNSQNSQNSLDIPIILKVPILPLLNIVDKNFSPNNIVILNIPILPQI